MNVHWAHCLGKTSPFRGQMLRLWIPIIVHGLQYLEKSLKETNDAFTEQQTIESIDKIFNH